MAEETEENGKQDGQKEWQGEVSKLSAWVMCRGTVIRKTIFKSTCTSALWKVIYLTDVSSGSRLVEKAFVYLTSVTRECRKALTEQFEQEHKGIPFGSVEKIMRQGIESWFAKRDPNIKLSHEKSLNGRPGEILMTYSGSTKDAHFKLHVDGIFTLAGSSGEAPSYLKNLNVRVDKRDFTR